MHSARVREREREQELLNQEMRMGIHLVVVLLSFTRLFTEIKGGGNFKCEPSMCSEDGPVMISFPFRLKERPEECGYPGRGFELFCSEENRTILQLNPPHSLNLSVENIDYISQHMTIGHIPDFVDCLGFSKQVINLKQDLSASPFRFVHYTYTIFNCSEKMGKDPYRRLRPTPCSFPSSTGHVYAVPANYDVSEVNLTSCRKILNATVLPEYGFSVSWSKPFCGDCKAQGNKCQRKESTNTKEPEIECIKPPQALALDKILLRAEIILGLLHFTLGISIIFTFYCCNKLKREHKVNVQKFLEDYRACRPSRYSYADVKRITSNFKDKLGQGGYGTVYKGKLSNDVCVAIKILDDFKGNGEEFTNEVGTMGTIHHINVVRLLGFCADGNKRALVCEFLPNESLDKFIFSAFGDNRSLAWHKLQDIALGIAKGIEYLHQGCDQRILHLDIKPHNILLDHNFSPKITDFGLAKLCSKEQSAVSMTAARGTMGYIAPEMLSRNFGNVSYKSDVYSFGMLLIEMVGGRKNIDVTVERSDEVYFPEWLYNHLLQEQDVRIRIKEENDISIAKKLSIIGLWCIQWYPIDRPSMKLVIGMLEGEEDNLVMPPNPFPSLEQTRTSVRRRKASIQPQLMAISEIE